MTTSNCTDFQARRLNLRYRAGAAGGGKGATQFCYTLNNTAIAVPRVLPYFGSDALPDSTVNQSAPGCTPSSTVPRTIGLVIRILATVLAPSAGEVRVNGVEIEPEAIAA